jgi:hypothetical protein
LTAALGVSYNGILKIAVSNYFNEKDSLSA